MSLPDFLDKNAIPKITKTLQAVNPRLLLLVDKQHSLPADSIPPDLIALDDYQDSLDLNRQGMYVSKLMLPDLLAMSLAAKEENISLLISSAYRDFSYQRMLFNRAVKTLGREQALRESAEQGKSQHQLGLALDFGSITPEFANTAAGIWLKQHASDFGFSLSYPSGAEEETGYMYESWHYRYIGREAAAIQKQYFSDSQQLMLEFWHAHKQNVLKVQEKEL